LQREHDFLKRVALSRAASIRYHWAAEAPGHYYGTTRPVNGQFESRCSDDYNDVHLRCAGSDKVCPAFAIDVVGRKTVRREHIKHQCMRRNDRCRTCTESLKPALADVDEELFSHDAGGRIIYGHKQDPVERRVRVVGSSSLTAHCPVGRLREKWR